MKYIFDVFEFEIIGANRVKAHQYGVKNGLEYSVSIIQKNWLERLTSSEQTKNIPNIVLKRTFRGMKLVFTKQEYSMYKYTFSSWFIPFGAGTSSANYATQNIVNNFIEAVQKSA
jgi:hypothetical protein